MKTGAVRNDLDLLEAWVDLSGGKYVLYVLGDVCTGRRRTPPVLVKKDMPGVPPSHLILELLDFGSTEQGRWLEIGYTERVADIHQYRQISICSGEDIIASIGDIEVVY